MLYLFPFPPNIYQLKYKNINTNRNITICFPVYNIPLNVNGKANISCQFVGPIFVSIVVNRVTLLQDGGLYVLVFQVTMGAVIKVAVIYIKEKYLTVDRGGAA